MIGLLSGITSTSDDEVDGMQEFFYNEDGTFKFKPVKPPIVDKKYAQIILCVASYCRDHDDL